MLVGHAGKAAKTQHVAHRKMGLEILASRLHHGEEANLDTARYAYSAFAAVMCFLSLIPHSVLFIIRLGFHTNHGHSEYRCMQKKATIRTAIRVAVYH